MPRAGHLSCLDLRAFDASSWAPLMLELSTSHASSWVLVGRLSCFELGTFDASSWAPLMLELGTSDASSWAPLMLRFAHL